MMEITEIHLPGSDAVLPTGPAAPHHAGAEPESGKNTSFICACSKDKLR